MPGSLSKDDVIRLLADPSAAVRADLAGKLGEDITQSSLAAGELVIAQDIARLLARDVAVAVRTALAHNLRHAQNLPRDVALRMADDVESVALPILTDSLVLTDNDLIELVRRGSPRRQEAIAARPRVSAPVSEVLVREGAERAVSVLMGNPAADITEASFTAALERFTDSDQVKEGMVRRESLPITVAERLAVLVSRSLQDHLVRHHALPATLAADLVMRGRETAIIRLSAGSDEPELLRLVSQMRHAGRLTPTLLLRALCTGDIAFFEAALAELAGVPVENARILVHDAGRTGLSRLYEKAGLPPRIFPMIRAAIDTVDESRFDGEPRDLERYRARVITRVLTQCEEAEAADADYLVEKLGDMLVG